MPNCQRGSDSVYTEPFPACTNTEGVWGDKGQAWRLRQSPEESGPAGSGLGVARSWQSRRATESGRLPVGRMQAGCPRLGLPAHGRATTSSNTGLELFLMTQLESVFFFPFTHSKIPFPIKNAIKL